MLALQVMGAGHCSSGGGGSVSAVPARLAASPLMCPHASPPARARRSGASLRLMWEAENTGGRPTPFAYVYLPSGTKGQQPGALQDTERCGQNVFQGAFPTLQARPAAPVACRTEPPGLGWIVRWSRHPQQSLAALLRHACLRLLPAHSLQLN